MSVQQSARGTWAQHSMVCRTLQLWVSNIGERQMILARVSQPRGQKISYSIPIADLLHCSAPLTRLSQPLNPTLAINFGHQGPGGRVYDISNRFL